MSQDLELLRAFYLESNDILERLGSEIAGLGNDRKNKALVDSIFRGLHTIKGNSSFLSLANVTKLAHSAEALLDKVRKGSLSANDSVIAATGEVFLVLKEMIEGQNVDRPTAELCELVDKVAAGGAWVAKGSSADVPKAEGAGSSKVALGSFVRVDEGKIGKMLSIATELELLRYSLELVPEKIDLLGPEASDLRFELDLQVTKVSRLARSLSSIMFGIRLVPVNQVFQRFPRVVQDLAQRLGKKIQLQVLNGEAELDKTIVEAIADPMTHLIRNSADHGIESPQQRIQAGKSEIGSIRLNSYVRGNFVYIEISDDGKGIDGDKILAKAVEKGIVPAEKAPGFTENQKLALIFAPGFSTAETVTEVSGRGVGMDVVKSNINKLKGTVIIESDVGKGTVIQLRFPISMVVLLSLFIDLNGTCCCVPVDQIDESIDFLPGDLLNQQENGDDIFAIYSLRQLLWNEPAPDLSKCKRLHTVRFKLPHQKAQYAFVVDEFLSIEETIVQSVDSYISALPGIQGASVRKDGSVALVLNPLSILSFAEKNQPIAYARRPKVEEDVGPNLSDFLDLASGA
jgi:two-component system, chemotaxis family, sensor kinase CheA